MPIVFEKSHSFYRIAVWRSEEPESELLQMAGLSNAESGYWSGIGNANRRREYLTVRAALKHLLGSDCPAIIYDATGKPSLSNGQFLSISHTGDLIALMHSESHNVGIDIEALRESIVPVSRKFVNDLERSQLPDKDLIENLHAVWSAKEVVYKIYGKKEVDFRKELQVEPFDLYSGQLRCAITKPDMHCTVEVHFIIFSGAMLGWGCVKS